MVQVETERVLVVSTELFHRLGYFQGFSREMDRYLEELFSPENTSYRSRSEVEEDPSYKQLIPYCVFRYRGEDEQETVFQYTRGGGQGEKRLHAKRSVGIGGHISAVDADGDGDIHPYDEGMRRELTEEVLIDTPYTQQQVGLINDDETAVGRVHLGVVHLFDVTEPRVHSREDDILEDGFRPVGDILSELEHFESWSQICMQALFGTGEK
ncbi:MAG: phosphoesterase [Planctomycetota bacterium]|nr:MAG: phosphoesterase [Planctomycetota bacterium]REK43128.1 MAG: phosphoesterase [Planctomycetota bacterium]